MFVNGHIRAGVAGGFQSYILQTVTREGAAVSNALEIVELCTSRPETEGAPIN
jgi:hypothetical protein